jgi:hypothetical protein
MFSACAIVYPVVSSSELPDSEEVAKTEPRS